MAAGGGGKIAASGQIAALRGPTALASGAPFTRPVPLDPPIDVLLQLQLHGHAATESVSSRGPGVAPGQATLPTLTLTLVRGAPRPLPLPLRTLLNQHATLLGIRHQQMQAQAQANQDEQLQGEGQSNGKGNGGHRRACGPTAALAPALAAGQDGDGPVRPGAQVMVGDNGGSRISPWQPSRSALAAADLNAAPLHEPGKERLLCWAAGWLPDHVCAVLGQKVCARIVVAIASTLYLSEFCANPRLSLPKLG
jgi:hypothetical protein